MSVITCCKDCENRHLACHDSCKIYLQQKQKYKDEIKWLKEQNAFENAVKKGDFLGDSGNLSKSKFREREI